LHVDDHYTEVFALGKRTPAISKQSTSDLDSLKKKKTSGCAGQRTPGLRSSFVQPTYYTHWATYTEACRTRIVREGFAKIKCLLPSAFCLLPSDTHLFPGSSQAGSTVSLLHAV